MKKRESWIDICKGLLISTIVLFHINYPFNAYIANITGLYKVVVFFCIAGLTLKDDRLMNTAEFIKHKIRTLYTKIIYVGVVAVLFHNILIYINMYSVDLDYYGKTVSIYSGIDIVKNIILTFLLANREVIIGPMWYANVLFLALVIISLTDLISRKVARNGNTRMVRFYFCVGMMIISYILSYIIGFTIPRFNNTLTAVFLIDFCQLIYTKYHFKFDNLICFISSCCVLLFLPFFGGIELNINMIVSPLYLVLCSFSGMYVLYFLSQKLEKIPYVKEIFSYIGRYSFHIMALQFLSFKLGSMFLGKEISTLTPVANNFYEVLYFLFFGVGFPCVFGALLNRLNIVRRRN